MTLRNPSCDLCPLHDGAETVCLIHKLRHADIMLVGEAPGANEDKHGKPFIGQAGALLNQALEKFAQIDRADCYVSNVCKCRPPENRPPARVEIKTCVNAYLRREIELVKPKFILAMGNSALLGVLGKSGIMKHHGTPVALNDETVFPTIHPAAVLRNPKWGADFALDLTRFGELVRGERNTPNTRIKIVRTVQHLRWLRTQLMQAKVISWDIETYTEPAEKPYVRTNLQYWHRGKSHIVSIAFSWEEGVAAVLPLWHFEAWREGKLSERYLTRTLLAYLKPALEREDCVYVAHNGKFDASWMTEFGVDVPQTFDTMLASHVLDENREKGLKSLARNMLGADGYDVGEELKNASTVPLQRLAVYNGKDADYTLRIAKRFRRELVEKGQAAKLFTKLLMPASRALTDIETAGVAIDSERWRERHDEVQEHCDQLRASVERRMPTSMRPINLRSVPQVSRLLYDHLGLPVLATSKKTGQPSTAEKVLMRLRNESPIVPTLLEYRKWYKYLSTYLLPWWFEHQDANGRIRASYKPTGTVTGRLSGTGGIQQIPRDPFVRSIICTAPGWKLLVADYSQIELRMAAMLAHEERMLRQFTKGEDIHMLRALKITGKARASEVTKEERARAKPVSFGFLYGMGANNFVDYAFEEYDVTYTLEEAQGVRRGFFTDYPKLLPWHARQRRLAQRYREVSSPMGRVRHLPDILSNNEKVRGEAERQAINSPVQVMASDIMLLALIELHRILPSDEARIVFTVHDSIGFEVRDGCVGTWAPLIRGVMEDTQRVERQFKCEINVPITVDLEVGTHYGEGKAIG
jgi:uracil-DNA glycosylase family 4